MAGPAFIIGTGPGVGASTAPRFGRAGHSVGLVARDRGRVGRLDGRQLGPPEVACFSPHPDVTLIKLVLETTPQDLRAALDLSVADAAATAQAVLPGMREADRGTLLFVTGSAVENPSADAHIRRIAHVDRFTG